MNSGKIVECSKCFFWKAFTENQSFGVCRLNMCILLMYKNETIPYRCNPVQKDTNSCEYFELRR